MSFAEIPLVAVMKAKLDYLSSRQAALAQNVASADLPNYKAQDVQEPDFKKMAFGGGGANGSSSGGQLKMATTNAKHISSMPVNAGGGNVITRASTFERNPNRNNVSIEEEMAKLSSNQGEYQKVLNLYSSTMSLFKTALDKTGG